MSAGRVILIAAAVRNGCHNKREPRLSPKSHARLATPKTTTTRGSRPRRQENADGLRALNQLALDRDTTAQALMIEPLNDLFRKYRRPMIAKTPPRPH
jgi:hypothetical protein